MAVKLPACTIKFKPTGSVQLRGTLSRANVFVATVSIDAGEVLAVLLHELKCGPS